MRFPGTFDHADECRLGTQPKGIGDAMRFPGTFDHADECRLGTQPKGIGAPSRRWREGGFEI